MTEIETAIALLKSNRERTLGLLTKIEAEPDPMSILGYRPGPGRAHLGWQLMHIAITEELFATERLKPGAKSDFPDVVPRFKGGSTPDDNIPDAATIRSVLEASREHLEATLTQLKPEQLEQVPEPLKERGWTHRTVLQVLAWHEAHHQGQAHLTLNLYKAQQVTP